MGKIRKAIRRADSMEDHVHRLPSGDLTGPALHKPMKDQFDMHSHLYECNEDTAETDIMHGVGDHVHKTADGNTSGPLPLPKQPGAPAQFKNDSAVSKEGRNWVVRSETGHVIGRGLTKEAALKSAGQN